tara:strand:- start:141 stop:488 length:348 start_codon:yes stop_codon:yes gene_type:complete
MGSLYIVHKSKYRAFTLLCADDTQYTKIIDASNESLRDGGDDSFIQDFLNKSWPPREDGGDSDLTDISKTGAEGDVAALIIVKDEGSSLSTETRLFERLAGTWRPYNVQTTLEKE